MVARRFPARVHLVNSSGGNRTPTRPGSCDASLRRGPGRYCFELWQTIYIPDPTAQSPHREAPSGRICRPSGVFNCGWEGGVGDALGRNLPQLLEGWGGKEQPTVYAKAASVSASRLPVSSRESDQKPARSLSSCDRLSGWKSRVGSRVETRDAF